MTSIAFGTSSPAVSAPRLRLTSRGRAVLVALVVAPVLVGAVLFGGGVPGAVAGSAAGTTTAADSFSYVEVAPGQSLWQLAESIAPATDPRDVISDLMRLNGLSSATVLAGQQLAVPQHYLG